MPAQAGLGLWQGAAEAPWDYRAAARLQPAAVARRRRAPPPDCDDQGQPLGRRGADLSPARQPAYARTRIDPARGEAWFCDEAAAGAAGFRPPRATKRKG